MAYPEYTQLARARVGDNEQESEVHEGLVEFMEVLCKLEDELLDWESRISDQGIDLTGNQAIQELSALEAEQSGYQDDIQEALKAIRMGSLKQLNRYPAEDWSNQADNAIDEYLHDLIEMVHRLEDISDRGGRRIDAKRNSANTRLVFSISVVAAIIAILSLVSQL